MNATATAITVAEQWRCRSHELATVALERWATRRDAWGQYFTLARRNGSKSFTAPAIARRGLEFLSADILDYYARNAEASLKPQAFTNSPGVTLQTRPLASTTWDTK